MIQCRILVRGVRVLGSRRFPHWYQNLNLEPSTVERSETYSDGGKTGEVWRSGNIF